MQPAGHASAAIEVLSAVESLRLPAAQALRDWGRAHRFAGSRDRGTIGTIVFDVLRRKASLAWRMDDETPRALVLGWLAFLKGLPLERIEEMAEARHGFGALSEHERERLLSPRPLEDAPMWVRADIPQWLEGAFADVWGERAVAEGAALAERAPLDLRANTLKADRVKVARALSRFMPEETPHSPWGLRIRPDSEGRLPNVEAEGAHGRGLFEIQDEGSQIATLLTGAAPGMQVLDLCAGGGGKTLALAAMMENRGQIFAHDADRLRLRPIHERIRRAGVRNVQVIEPHMRERLESLEGRMHVTLVDAPCTGTGTWRRHPDAKWRLTEKALKARMETQDALLDDAARFVRPGGRLVYVTCSILKVENEDRMKAFLSRHPDFSPIHWRDVRDIPSILPDSGLSPFLRLSPLQHGTDGFFIAVLEHA